MITDEYTAAWYDAMTVGAMRSARIALPPLLAAVEPRSVLDVGCGIGAWAAVAAELGVPEVHGVDGDHVDPGALVIGRECFTAADLQEPLDLGRTFGLVLSLEVGEHLPEAAADGYVASLVRHGDVVLFSAAVPDQGGQHHVNERWPAYWSERFAAHGYVAVDFLRPRLWEEPEVEHWYLQNLVVFLAEARLGDFPDLAAEVLPGAPAALVHPRLFAARSAEVTELAERARGGLAAALLARTLPAATGPDLADNVDETRFPDGQWPVPPEEVPLRLGRVLGDLERLDRLHAALDPESAGVLVDVLAYRVLGRSSIRMPFGTGADMRALVALVDERLRVESSTASSPAFGWALDLFDLGALGLPLRLHSHPGLVVPLFLLDQYRYDGVAACGVRPGDVVIDAGGCWGETSLLFAHQAGPEGRVLCAEFDVENLALLERNLALNPELAARIDVLQQPLWSHAGERLAFESFGPGTKLGAGPCSVETTSIDALVASGRIDRVDFVKMDIEGAETAALEGAREVLRRFRPRLAISAYHRDADLGDLSSFLLGLGVGYRLALDHYTMHAEETVLYAWVDD